MHDPGSTSQVLRLPTLVEELPGDEIQTSLMFHPFSQLDPEHFL
jgi:hypothetical protein